MTSNNLGETFYCANISNKLQNIKNRVFYFKVRHAQEPTARFSYIYKS